MQPELFLVYLAGEHADTSSETVRTEEYSLFSSVIATIKTDMLSLSAVFRILWSCPMSLEKISVCFDSYQKAFDLYLLFKESIFVCVFRKIKKKLNFDKIVKLFNDENSDVRFNQNSNDDIPVNFLFLSRPGYHMILNYLRILQLWIFQKIRN